jgi:23S rRNA (cytosine1962-C5)-methyltransferase
MMNRDLKRVDLLPGREKRLLLGHRWVFSNEISGNASAFEPGSWVTIHSSRGVCLGSGYINPYSLIAVRLVCAPHEKPTPDFFRDLLEKAAMRRRTMFYPDSSCARMVYGEADGLPGLVVDCYGDVVVYQITTLGMALMEDLVKDLLLTIFRPKALVFRHDSPIRLLEGLPLEKGIASGDLPDPCWIEVDGLEFVIDPLNGQKTGFYLDQRDNRKVLRRWSKGKKVLDLFCYNGAWSLSAASAGAQEVLGVDQSADGIIQAGNSAARNNVEKICRFQEEEVFYFLKNLKKGAFDLVILDPPAFAKTKRVVPQAIKGYTDINRRACWPWSPEAFWSVVPVLIIWVKQCFKRCF